MGHSYCKKDYSKGEVNLAQITQITVQKGERSYGKLLLFG